MCHYCTYQCNILGTTHNVISIAFKHPVEEESGSLSFLAEETYRLRPCAETRDSWHGWFTTKIFMDKNIHWWTPLRQSGIRFVLSLETRTESIQPVSYNIYIVYCTTTTDVLILPTGYIPVQTMKSSAKWNTFGNKCCIRKSKQN